MRDFFLLDGCAVFRLVLEYLVVCCGHYILFGGGGEISYDNTSMVCIKITVGLVVSLHCWQDIIFTVPAKYAARKHIRESLAH